MKKHLLLIFLLIIVNNTFAIDPSSYISYKNSRGSFSLSAHGKSAPLYISPNDYPGVIRALKDLQTDITNVTKAQPRFSKGNITATGDDLVLVGTVGKSALIDKLIKSGKLNVDGIADKWESFIIQTINNPIPGVAKALVIAGSDKRGTIFGIYDVSAQIGVSPWYWWADVPVKHHNELYILPGRHTMGEPAVKYRGIFINDEAPAFSGWAKEKFGGANHKVYEKVFELILRMKGNYLWPAMWDNAFNDDDKLDPKLADEYGIVMGTSHHEPMDRAQQEWKRYGTGAWNYETNSAVLKDFWRKGIQNMGTNETIVTVGMRGDGDMAMTEGSNVALLEKIVKDQRQILAEETHKDASQTPQLWALYKEVQDYYDKGMRVPDDVTLLLCDDNWGNIRKLPKLNEARRGGGYGIYYHFDYVGGPRNYKWLNTNPISKVWEQMHLAKEYGANRIWIVNVGDLKPMEFPIEFFLDYAWSPNKWPANSLQQYTKLWAQKQFGAQYAVQIANILSKYTKYNGRRKPELLDQNTYSLTNYREFETVVADYNKLKDEAEAIYKKIPAEYKAAYFQLVLHPVKACANLNELYYTTAKNQWYAQQGRAATNDMAAKAKTLFNRDAQISSYYNDTLANGKWHHMMDQTHIGYTYWQQPGVNAIPAVKQIEIPTAPDMGVAIESSTDWWPSATTEAALPQFNSIYPALHYIEIFNRGKEPFAYKVQAPSFINITDSTGQIDKQKRLLVSINWKKVPRGLHEYPLIIKANGKEVHIKAILNNQPILAGFKGFAENNGYVSIEAAYYTKAVHTNAIQWGILPDYGRTLSAVTTFPVTVANQMPGGNSPHLEYKVYFTSTGNIKLAVYISPTIDFTNTTGLKYAISVDDEQPQIINLQADNSNKAWERSVADNIKILVSNHHISTAGVHTVKYWMVSPGVVLQKMVIDRGGLKPSYLGPPETYISK